MRTRDVPARAVVAPLEPPVRTASGHVTQAPLLLIDLTTDEGIVGRSYLFGYHAFTLAPLRELVVALGEIVKGNVLAPVELDKTMRSRMTLFGTRGLQGVAVAGVDMAAWDALAVRAGCSARRDAGQPAAPDPRLQQPRHDPARRGGRRRGQDRRVRLQGAEGEGRLADAGRRSRRGAGRPQAPGRRRRTDGRLQPVARHAGG